MIQVPGKLSDGEDVRDAPVERHCGATIAWPLMSCNEEGVRSFDNSFSILSCLLN